ncbi:MAG: type II toxin-antitoxin system RelE/ParE family toxin [Campylobacterales bacterium]|nr:type II toxin-antitoxin system RelE/ParE family toxin [Campylobacterales bacterium]
MIIEVLDEAEKDIEKGFYFYESNGAGLGRYFVDSILPDIDSLVIFGGIHFQVNGYFRLLSKKFPYGIYYKMQDEKIFVYGVLDSRQNPINITQRIQ